MREAAYKLGILYRGLETGLVATIDHVRLQAKARQLGLTARTKRGLVRARTRTHTCQNSRVDQPRIFETRFC